MILIPWTTGRLEGGHESDVLTFSSKMYGRRQQLFASTDWCVGIWPVVCPLPCLVRRWKRTKYSAGQENMFQGRNLSPFWIHTKTFLSKAVRDKSSKFFFFFGGGGGLVKFKVPMIVTIPKDVKWVCAFNLQGVVGSNHLVIEHLKSNPEY